MADKVKRSSALRLKRTLFTVVTTLLLAPSLLGQCTGKLDQRSSKTSGVFIADMKIAGTRTLGVQSAQQPRKQTRRALLR
jgi:hypothetical protein